MDPGRYQDTVFGAPARRPGDKWAFWHYRARPLPRDVPLSSETVYALSMADSSLGHLHGLGTLVRDPQLLLGPYLKREALASSTIEGTNTSLADILKAEASDHDPSMRDDQVEEVERYIRASNVGYRLLATLPLTQRLIREAHRELVSGVRGSDKLPGEFRRTPVWIGSATDNPDTASYVPPLPEDVADLLTDWERYVNETSRVPTLIRAALMHYQFETIHPFLDGNGRIGRLLVGLMLVQEGRLTSPLLYISGYLEMHRRRYYDLLQGVRERGEIQEWIQFFLTAVTHSADDAVQRASHLVSLREEFMKDAATARSQVGGLVDLIFSNPFLTARRVESHLGVTNQGARNLLRDAQHRGWVSEPIAMGRSGRLFWLADQVFDVIERPFGYNSVTVLDETHDSMSSTFSAVERS